MSRAVEFWFEFSSPYGYLASHRIDAIATRHGREVRWRPYLLGVAFRKSGRGPQVDYPLLREYSLHDMQRCARLHGIAFHMPERFPVSAMAATRAFYSLVDSDATVARDLARRVYAAYFRHGRDISDPETVIDEAVAVGIDGDRLRADLQDEAVKRRAKEETEKAIERGVFGSPFVLVDGEPFWGNDRLEQVDHWLATGGW